MRLEKKNDGVMDDKSGEDDTGEVRCTLLLLLLLLLMMMMMMMMMYHCVGGSEAVADESESERTKFSG